MSETTLVSVVVATVAVALSAFVIARMRRKPFVLGQQLADAHANEKARLAAGNAGPSPMPASEYDEERGEYALTSVTELPLDKALQGVVRAFESADAGTRATMQGSISLEEQYTLIQFAKRSAVLAVRTGSVARCGDGLLALAMIDETRIDPRDASWAAGLLGHAVASTSTDAANLVSRAAGMARPGMATILAEAATGSSLADWGYREIRTGDGVVGFIASEFARYEPTLDLASVALRLAANLQRGRYLAEPKLAAKIPEVWFEPSHRESAQQLLRLAKAGVAIRGRLRKIHVDDPASQQYSQWVVEMPTADNADTLVRYVGPNGQLGDRFVIGVAAGRLFSLLVAGSCRQGVAPFESRDSLGVLARETAALLQTLSPE
jgi:hypothetical protein